MLNPTWDALDENGVPLTPRWSVQEGQGSAPLCLPDPEDDDVCGGFPKGGGVPQGRPACNDMAVPEPPVGDVAHGVVCNLGRGFRKFAGHLNYLPATYAGLIYFENHAWPDDDLDFEMLPLEPAGSGWRLTRAGLTTRRRMKDHLVTDAALESALRNKGLDYVLHVEAKAEETVASFTQAWWEEFRRLGDEGEEGKEKRKRMVSGRPAVVTGLLGLDAEHGAFTEIHPAHALAIQTECGEADPTEAGAFVDTWAVFIRNSGNEGWCSQWDLPHYFDSPGGVFTLALPASFSGKMDSAELLPSSELFASRADTVRSPLELQDEQLVVRFRWPSDLGLREHVRIHGVMKVRWRPVPGKEPACVDLAPALANSPGDPTTLARGAEPPAPEEEASAEEFLRQLEAPDAAERVAPPTAFRARERAPSRDTSPVAEAAVPAPSPPAETGPCPGNVASCSDEVRPWVADRTTPPTVRRVFEAQEADTICGLAEDRARRRDVALDHARLNRLLDACRRR
jgi:hypothetical protein